MILLAQHSKVFLIIYEGPIGTNYIEIPAVIAADKGVVQQKKVVYGKNDTKRNLFYDRTKMVVQDTIVIHFSAQMQVDLRNILIPVLKIYELKLFNVKQNTLEKSERVIVCRFSQTSLKLLVQIAYSGFIKCLSFH